LAAAKAIDVKVGASAGKEPEFDSYSEASGEEELGEGSESGEGGPEGEGSEEGSQSGEEKASDIESTSEAELEMIEEELETRAAALKELPYTFEAPQTYDDLVSLFKGWSAADQLTIVERLIILYNPKLGPDAREKLVKIMELLFEHLDVSSAGNVDMEYIKGLEKHLIGLCRQSSVPFARFAKEKITNVRDCLNKALRSTKLKQAMVSLGDILFFKIVAQVYSTSDMFHPVVTPTLLLICQYLAQASVNSNRDVLSGLLLCDLLHEV
jgi:nucleolar protein 14